MCMHRLTPLPDSFSCGATSEAGNSVSRPGSARGTKFQRSRERRPVAACRCAMLLLPVSPTEVKQKENARDEQQIPDRDARRAASDVRGSGGVRTGSDPGGKGPRTAITGIDKEKCSGSDQRPVRGAVELQTGAGSLVRGASDRTHRGGGGFSPGLHQGKSHGRAGGGTRAGRQED